MAHNINQKKAHGGKVKDLGNAPGSGPATGMMKTPAPTKKLAPDVISAPRNPASVGGYGMNASGLANPSSIPPGTSLRSKMADVLAEAQDDGEGALDKVIANGTKTDDMVAGQLRKIAEGNVPDHPNMKSQTARPGGTYDFDTLPATVGSSAAQPVRKP